MAEPNTSSSTRSRRSNKGRRRNTGESQNGAEPHSNNTATSAMEITSTTTELDDANEAAVCLICAVPVKYYSVSECDHRTCHVCTLRMRALYKNTTCAFCKVPQITVIFTVSPDEPFSSFTPDRIPYKDQKLSIFFETKEMMDETCVLLQYNCPESTCDYSASGWSDLKLHVRGIHAKIMCDICVRGKHVFSHEHILYTSSQLATHLPSTRRSYKSVPKEQVEGGTHPLCEFCNECFFGDDEIFKHMRERHEECFICKRNNVKDQYFFNYNSLEKHFHSSHHACMHLNCLTQKFVVFNSAIDLQAHMVEDHGASMTSRDKKDARRIQANFEFEDINLVGRGTRMRRGGDNEREHEPPSGSSNGARPIGSSRRREGFGSTLTVVERATSSNAPGFNRHLSSSPPSTNYDPAVNERHQALKARMRSLDIISSTTQLAVEAAVRSFTTSESSARDLISTIWYITDHQLESTATVIVAIVDVLEEESKKQELLASWNGFKIQQRQQFPDLVPVTQGAVYAGVVSGHALNLRNLTNPRTSQQSSRQVWDRVAQAANSSHSFPIPKLPIQSQSPQASIVPPVSGFRQGQRNTPWSSNSNPGMRSYPLLTSQPNSRNKGSGPSSAPGTRTQTPPPKLSNTLFPELPSTSAARQKTAVKGNQSLKNIVGDSAPSGSVWGAGSGLDVSGDGAIAAGDDKVAEGKGTGSGTPKKGKGKQKQTLFTIGTFPG